MADRADTVPGFMMQSENFFLKFITGLQCGVSSKLLEYETDWYEVMEIILSRLEDEPENKEKFEMIASRDLEYWARVQPGGEALNLKIRVVLEEKRYFQPPTGFRKTMRLIFNDRFSTQVLFHARKKQFMKSLRDISAVAVADQICNESQISELSSELPLALMPTVRRAFNNCWTARHARNGMTVCPDWCSCKTDVYKVIASLSPASPDIQPPTQPPQPQEQPSTSGANQVSKKQPRKSTKKCKAKKSANIDEEKNKRTKKASPDCDKCSRKVNKSKGKVSMKINCRDKSLKSDSKHMSSNKTEIDLKGTRQKQDTDKVLRRYKSQLIQLKSRLNSYLTVSVKRLEKNTRKIEDDESSPKRKSQRLSKLKELIQFSKKRVAKEEEIFEPRPDASSRKGNAGAGGSKAAKHKFDESKAVKRKLRNPPLESASSRKRRRHS